MGGDLLDSLEHFSQIEKYHEIGQLLLTALEKEKDELRVSDSHFRVHINDLQVAMCVLQETCSHSTEIAENQVQSLIN